MALTRRRLLQLLGVAAGAAALPLAWRRFGRGSADGTSADVAAGEEPFPYLTLGSGVVAAFEADYRRHVGALRARDRWSDRIKAQFLLSTDFFRFDADETRVISYVGFYDPAVTPCNNPLARFEDA
jgi:hypothetical protein